jgi:heat shock protein HslJ
VELEEQSWVLLSGIAMPQDVVVMSPSVTFSEGRVAGTTGCNRYMGAYEVEGDSLAFGPIATTMMACPPPADAVERAYVAALASVTGWRRDGDQLVLELGEDDEPLRFVSAETS